MMVNRRTKYRISKYYIKGTWSINKWNTQLQILLDDLSRNFQQKHTVYSRLEKGFSTSRKTKGRPLMYTTY